jgi:succinate dehydrogenase / fumarate reductase membrane anchor subunit
MRYLTDRKRVDGLGSAKTGTAHFWAMKTSSVALLLLIPLFVFMFGAMLGKPHDQVVVFFSRPLPAIVVALTLIVGFEHFKSGVHVLIEDYVHGMAQKIWIIAMTCLSYAAMAVGLFAIAKIAL